jgi:excisionase family DNA binding protein
MRQNNQTQETTNRPFMSIDEAADYLGLSKATLYQYTHRKVLDFYKVRGKKIYFLKEDLDQFIMNDDNLVKSIDHLEEDAEALMKEVKS